MVTSGKEALSETMVEAKLHREPLANQNQDLHLFLRRIPMENRQILKLNGKLHQLLNKALIGESSATIVIFRGIISKTAGNA